MRRGQVTLQLGLQQVVTGRIELGREAPVRLDRGGQSRSTPDSRWRTSGSASGLSSSASRVLSASDRANTRSVIASCSRVSRLSRRVIVLCGSRRLPAHAA
ncbi:MAG TPA: hypothetical protein VK284_06675 [Streptosporangiaceae bacterium]|nr:hypothetical protein [Streptosporangiaceae bacterium]HLN70058.1 hypothetical protein [Streptosporangiaceae bacterium]